jgi:succinate-semialdehyde dehydrogenase/glutarate-semialdehyde dehydrogenase
MGEATYAAEFFRWFAEEAVRADGLITHAPASGARIVVQHKPAGIAVLVTPWNYPAAMGTRKIAPALAAGCPVIIKPASETPLTMLALMPLAGRGRRAEGAGQRAALEEGSAQACRPHAARSARAGHFVHRLHRGRPQAAAFGAADQVLKPAMELGGNAPLIVFEDADIDTAVEGAMLAKMRNLGEACTAANRFYVHERSPRSSPASSPPPWRAEDGRRAGRRVDVGPLVNADTRDKVAAFRRGCVAKGAKLELGGTLPNGKGFFYPPTVLSNVPETADCVHDEIFGPVAAIQTFTDEADVIRRANDTEYGLVAYVFTEDMKRGMQVCERLEYGMVGLNRGLVSDPAAPFGGVKQSGLGREGGHEGMLEFMETQYISAEAGRRRS